MTTTKKTPEKAQDLTPSRWDRVPFLAPYARLARWDRPVGILLLFWPCVWGLALAPSFKLLQWPERFLVALVFFIGAIAMRGAGCTLNDLTDRKLDAQVARTKNRPLASGKIKPWQAIIFMLLQLGIGAWILLQLSPLAIYLGLGTLPLIALYPWMKRITWWPQALLGIIFNSGALIAYAAMENTLSWPAGILYLSGFVWTLAYDSVYAHMDREDDKKAGIKSTALLWILHAKTIIGFLWVGQAALFMLGLYLAAMPLVGYVLVWAALAANLVAHLRWNPENERYSLVFFRLQARIGLLLTLATLAALVF